jgi:hypothetical protein
MSSLYVDCVKQLCLSPILRVTLEGKDFVWFKNGGYPQIGYFLFTWQRAASIGTEMPPPLVGVKGTYARLANLEVI